MMISWLPLLGLNLTLAVLPTLMTMVSLMRKIVVRKRPARKNFRVVLTQTATVFRILTINAPRLQAKLNLTAAPTRTAMEFPIMRMNAPKQQAMQKTTAARKPTSTVFLWTAVSVKERKGVVKGKGAETRAGA